jgi:ABC-type bacteriocin/lantibiotic exporter with double-glycine peptidase domain
MFKYSWKLTLVVLASNFPLVFSTRLSWYCTHKWNANLQKAKAEMCSFAEETLSNIRTVKAFSDEKQCIAKYNEESQKVFFWGERNAIVWGYFMA